MLDFPSKKLILTEEVSFMALPAEKGIPTPESARVFTPRFYNDYFGNRFLSKELLIGQLQAHASPVEDVSETWPATNGEEYPNLSPVVTMPYTADVFERIADEHSLQNNQLGEGERPLFIRTIKGEILPLSPASELGQTGDS